MNELNKLIDQYIKLHPNATNPMDWIYVAGIEYLTEMLINAKGRELYYVLADQSVLDGGYIAYKEN